MALLMELEKLILFLLMLVILPIMILSSNHNIFFIITGIIIIIISIRNLYIIIFKVNINEIDDEDEYLDDPYDSEEFNIAKIGLGTVVVKNLVVILFFVYCVFHINLYILKILISIIIAYYIYYLKNSINEIKEEEDKEQLEFPLGRVIGFAVNLSAIIIVIFTACNKFISQIY